MKRRRKEAEDSKNNPATRKHGRRKTVFSLWYLQNFNFRPHFFTEKCSLQLKHRLVGGKPFLFHFQTPLMPSKFWNVTPFFRPYNSNSPFHFSFSLSRNVLNTVRLATTYNNFTAVTYFMKIIAITELARSNSRNIHLAGHNVSTLFIVL